MHSANPQQPSFAKLERVARNQRRLLRLNVSSVAVFAAIAVMSIGLLLGCSGTPLIAENDQPLDTVVNPAANIDYLGFAVEAAVAGDADALAVYGSADAQPQLAALAAEMRSLTPRSWSLTDVVTEGAAVSATLHVTDGDGQQHLYEVSSDHGVDSAIVRFEHAPRMALDNGRSARPKNWFWRGGPITDLRFDPIAESHLARD